MASLPLSTPPPLTAQNRHNFRHLYFDISWWGLFIGTTVSFITVYATRLGASLFQIGLFSSGVAVISLFISIPAGHWLEGRPLVRTVTRLALWHRLCFALLIVLPWAFGHTPSLEVAWVIGLYLAAAVFGIMSGIGFNALFADVVPPEWRAQVVGRRLAIHSLVVIGTSWVAGQILDRIVFPLNYQIIFSIGTLGALMTCYHLAQLQSPNAPPPRVNQPINDLTQRRFPGLGLGLRFLTRSSGKRLLRWDLVRGSFGIFLLIYLIFHTAIYFSIPLYPIFAVRELKLPDSVISLGPILTYTIISVISFLSTRVKLSDQHLIIVSAVLYGLQPLCLMLAQGADVFYWLSALAVGGGAATLGIGLTSRLMSRAPEDDRPAHMALYNMAIYIGVLAGSVLGPMINDLIGLRPTLGLGAGLMMLCTLLIWRWG